MEQIPIESIPTTLQPQPQLPSSHISLESSSKSNSKVPPVPNPRYQKFKQIMKDLLSKFDFFKATTSLCFEGKPTSSSAFGGFITIVVFMFSFYMSGWPFKDSYISSVNLMDDIVYNYTGSHHPLAINITLPPNSPPLLNNITIQIGCKYSKSDSQLYMFQAFGEPCQLGDYCTPSDFACPLSTSLDKEVQYLVFGIYLCESQFDSACDTIVVEGMDYINITVGYYSDEVSFTDPQFNRFFITRNISIPMRSSGAIQQELEINFFDTNTYYKGIFGFESIQLSSLRYSESYSTQTIIQPTFIGLSQGDSLFSYSLTTKQSSKQITHHFPNINSWISQVVSFTSIVTILIGFLFGYYETNIMLLKLMSYLKYAIEPNGKHTNFREESLKTILAGYLYHKWIMWLLPNCVLNYFRNHFLALEEGQRIIRLEYVLNSVAKISLEENKIYKVDLDDQSLDLNQNQNQQDTDYSSSKIQKRLKLYIKQKYQYLINKTQQQVFLSFIKIQGYNYKQALKCFEIIFGEERYESDREYEHLRNQYYVFREEAYPDYVNQVYFMDEEDIKKRESKAESSDDIAVASQKGEDGK